MPPAKDRSFSAAERAALRLALIAGVAPRLRQRHMERFGDAESVLAASPSALTRVAGVGPRLAARLAAAVREVDVDRELEVCRRCGLDLLLIDDRDYPAWLREIHDPPPVLFLRGRFEPCDAAAVAIVGTRRATRYGLEMAERLGHGLALAGVTVVSGLARGIDAAAHRGSLAAGGRTVAVLAGGVERVYPPEHVKLAGRVAEQGVVLSEAAPLCPPRSGAFPQRNRLISGLSLGVVVVEAARRSGALITARHALDQGREVFAVPGRADCPVALGCLELLRDGARLVTRVDDVLDELRASLLSVGGAPSGTPPTRLAPADLNDDERRVLESVGAAGVEIDRVLRDCGLPTPAALAAITGLEMRRVLRRVGGARLERCW